MHQRQQQQRGPSAAIQVAANTAALASSSSSNHSLDGEPLSGPLQPLRGMVLLQKVGVEQKTKGGLLLPTDARQEKALGRVIATGPGQLDSETGKRITCEVKEGDVVVYTKHTGETLKYDGADCVLLSSEELLAKVADPEALQPSDVQPLGDTVFVRVLKPSDKSAGGLLLVPQQQQRLLQQAEVVAVGSGKMTPQQTRMPVEVSVGDKVVYSSYLEESSQLKIGEQIYAFVRASDIAAKW
ncbi:10 kDa chaperonin, putative [Eimeria acervulina]|uniref:20 kDa chaperonin, chloroplastic n=1 Tax=Eimeria acervulina TaxID=5801 RepID=U6GEB2_EIMAC|nr:10 kDa chaperonin, putative [Eimeria acervulina]CDI77882.1 10 kDa chaperonin, putative [Eimeria acervulina]